MTLNSDNKAVVYINGRSNRHERIAELAAARRMGLKVIALSDKNPDFVSNNVDIKLSADTSNFKDCSEAIARIGNQFNIQGIVNWSETDTIMRHALARHFNLPAMAEKAALRCRDKYLAKEHLRGKTRYLPRFCSVLSIPDLQGACQTIGFPAVLKPAGGSGSKGIFILNTWDEALIAYNELMRITDPGFDRVFTDFEAKLILEEFLEGDEVSVEGYVGDNGIHIVGITDKWTTDTYRLETRHLFPSIKSQQIKSEIILAAHEIIEVLGIKSSPFHLEGMWTKEGFRFIECAARPGGDYITTHLVPMASCGEHVENCVRVAAGGNPKPIIGNPYFSTARFLFAPQSGTFESLLVPRHLPMFPEIEHVFCNAREGDQIHLPPQDYGPVRIGVIIGRAVDPQSLLDVTERCAEGCDIKMKSF